jgi:hypothetical protein
MTEASVIETDDSRLRLIVRRYGLHTVRAWLAVYAAETADVHPCDMDQSCAESKGCPIPFFGVLGASNVGEAGEGIGLRPHAEIVKGTP